MVHFRPSGAQYSRGVPYLRLSTAKVSANAASRSTLNRRADLLKEVNMKTSVQNELHLDEYY